MIFQPKAALARGMALCRVDFLDRGNNVEVDAVPKAADDRIQAREALLAAKQGSQEIEAKQDAVDIAGSQLVVAVMRWRSERDPG
jgi:hypothetical protein